MLAMISLHYLDEATKLHQDHHIYNPYFMLHWIQAKISNHEKLQNNSNFSLVYMATCMYRFRTLSKYTNDYHSFSKKYKLVRHADSELIICIKPTYIPTNVQLIHYACHGIFTLIRRCYKVTPKLRYLPSICHVALNSSINIQPWKSTRQLKFHTCLHTHMYLHIPYA